MRVHQGTPVAAPQPAPPKAVNDPLPATARAKLVALQGQSNDARDAARSASVRLNTLQAELRGPLKPGEAATASQELTRLTEVRAKQNERHATFLTLVDRCRQFVQNLPPGTALEVAKPPKPDRLKGESISESLIRIRDVLGLSKQHRNAVAAAPLPKEALKAVAKAYVADMAARGTPKLASEADRLKVVFGDPRSFVPQGVKGAAELMCWLDPERVLRRLEAEIDALPYPAVTIEASERERRLAELNAEIDRLEREEEALIEEAAGDGIEVLRRPEASPTAVLGVRLKSRIPRARLT